MTVPAGRCPWFGWAAWVVVAACLSVAAGSARAEEKSTPEERTKAVRLAAELEKDPLAPDAVEKRRWLIEWYTRVPDITVTVCNLLGPMPETDHPYFKEVLVQMMFAGGAFQIEHPDLSGDAVAQQTAGVLGALRAYEKLAARSGQRMPFLDDLVAKRNGGTLGEHMTTAVPAACKGSR
jgi:hypothetical protein